MSAIPSVQSLLDALKGALAPGDATTDKTTESISNIERQMDSLQSEMTSLQDEVNLLRRRDETLGFYMQRVDEEMRLAARLQQDFLPKNLPQLGKVRFHSLYRPAGYVSGDLYDVMRLDESHVGFYMADAVGHGMPAALLTMFLKQALVTKEIDAAAYRLLAPAQTMAKLNDALVTQNLSQATFATALYGHLDTRTLKLTFAKGGHPSPILLTGDGELRPLESDGPLLGIFPGETFEQTTVQLSPGDRLFIYSDGVELVFSDEPSPDSERWRHELHDRRHLGAADIVREFNEHLDRVVANASRKRDDLTVIAMEIAGG